MSNLILLPVLTHSLTQYRMLTYHARNRESNLNLTILSYIHMYVYTRKGVNFLLPRPGCMVSSIDLDWPFWYSGGEVANKLSGKFPWFATRKI